MIVPLVLLIAALSALVATLSLPGLADYVVLVAPVVLAAGILVLRATVRRQGQGRAFARGDGKPRWILVDGSNVLYWKDATPHLDTLREVIAHLIERGYTPGVVFDANVGYLVSGSYQHDGALGRLLGLPTDRIMVVPKGSTADATLLVAARDLGARIVSNDRYRDWAQAHPEVLEPGYLIKGAYRDSGLWLDLDDRPD